MKRLIYILLISVSCTLSGQQEAVLLMKGRALGERGDYGAAVNLLSNPAIHGNSYKAAIEIGKVFRLSGELQKANGYFLNAEKMVPGSASLELAETYSMLGDIDASYSWLLLHMASEFKRSEKEIMVNSRLASLSKTTKWREFWKEDHYSTTEKQQVQVDYLIRQGDFVEASELIATLKKSAPLSEKNIYLEASLYLGINDLKKAYSLLSVETSAIWKSSELRLLKAEVEIKAGNYLAAAGTYTRLLGDGIIDPSVLLLRSGAYQKAGESNKAIGDLDLYLEIYPGNEEANILMAVLLSSSGEYYRSLALLSENIDAKPGRADYYRSRADVYYKSGSYSSAYADLSMSLDLEPSNADAWQSIGLTLVKMGRVSEACHFFKRSGELGSQMARGYIDRYCK